MLSIKFAKPTKCSQTVSFFLYSARLKAIYDQHGEDVLREGVKDYSTGGKF